MILRLTARLALGLAALLVLLLAALLWLGRSEAGLRLALRLAAPPGLSIDAARGRLVGPVEFDGLVLDSPGLRISIARGRLDWQPRALLGRELRIEPLGLEDVVLETRAAETGRAGQAFRPPALPLAIDIRSVVIDALRWQRGDAVAAAVEGLALSLRYDASTIVVRDFQLGAPQVEASGTARLGLEPPHPVELALDWRLPPTEDRAELAGQIRASGDLDGLELAQRLIAPFPARLEVLVREPLGSLAWQAEIEARGVDPGALVSGWPHLAADVRFSVAGTRERIEADGSIVPAAGPFDALQLAFAGRWSERRLELEWLRLIHGDAELQASGELALADALRYRLAAGWRALAWPLTGEPWITSPDGEVTIEGDLRHYSGRLQARIAARGSEPVPLRTRFDGDRSGLRLADLEAGLLGGQLSGAAHLGWGATPVFAGVLRARELDLTRLAAHLKGRFDIDLRGNAIIRDRALHYSVALERLRGTINGEPLAGQALLEGGPDHLAIADARLEAGRNLIVVQGKVDERYDIDWRVEAEQLDLLLPDAAGRLASAGSLVGPRRTPKLAGRLDLEGLRYGRYRAQRGSAHAQVDLSGGQTDWFLELTEPSIGETRLARLEAQGSGDVEAHRVTARLTGAHQELDLALDGRYADERWQGEIGTLSIDTGELGRWSLAVPVPFDARFDLLAVRIVAVELDQLCLRNAASALCAGGRWSAGEPWSFAAQATAVALARLAPWLPAGFDYRGELAAQALLRGAPAERWTADGMLRLQSVEVTQPLADAQDGEQISLLTVEQGRLEFDLGAEQTRAQLRLELAGEDFVQGSLGLERRRGIDARVDGRLHGRLSDLTALPLLVPQVASASGELDVDLSIDGTRAAPGYRGRLELRGGRLHLIDLGITVTEIDLAVDGEERTLSLRGGGRSGDGRLALSGELNWAAPLTGRLKLEGEDFRIVSLPEARIDASPDLTLTLEGRRLELDGRVTVPRARLDPAELSGAVRPSPDETVVGREERQRKRGWLVSSRLRLALGEQIELDAFGLEARLTGQLRVVHGPDSVATASGELQAVEGTYRAYGQELEIERGRLLYTGGPLDNPGLDVRAIRRVGEITVGVDIRGTLLRPQLSLFSEPAMPPTQAMSYLLFGRPMTSLEESDRQLAAGAASSLALKGGVLLAQRLGRNLGLEDVTVEAEGSGQETSVVLGTYFSPRLYVSYGIGLFEAIDSFRLRYRLGERWTLEAESGLEESADLLYTIER